MRILASFSGGCQGFDFVITSFRPEMKESTNIFTSTSHFISINRAVHFVGRDLMIKSYKNKLNSILVFDGMISVFVKKFLPVRDLRSKIENYIKHLSIFNWPAEGQITS